jgi:hypothetical protein
VYKEETLHHSELKLLKVDGGNFVIDKSFMYGLLNKRTVRDIEKGTMNWRSQSEAGHEVIQSLFRYDEVLDRPDVRLPNTNHLSFTMQTKVGGSKFFQVKAHIFYLQVESQLVHQESSDLGNSDMFLDNFLETMATRIQKQLLKIIAQKKDPSKAGHVSAEQRGSERDSLILANEMLIVCFTFERRFSKISLHKLRLTWNDIKEFYSHEGLLGYLRKGDADPERSELLMHSISPQSLFLLFINYILSHCEHEKNILYKTIVIKIPDTKSSPVPQFLKNRWDKFKPSPPFARLKAMVCTTQNLTLVFSGVRRVLGSYFLIKVIKNRLLKQFQVVFYYQKTCRQFVFTLDPSDLDSTKQGYLSSITRLILGMQPSDLPKDYQDFYRLLLQKELITSKKELASKSLVVRSLSSLVAEEMPLPKPFKEKSLKVISVNQHPQTRFKGEEFQSISKNVLPKILVTNERGSVVKVDGSSIRRNTFDHFSKNAGGEPPGEICLKDLLDYTEELRTKEQLGEYLRLQMEKSRSPALFEFVIELEQRVTFAWTTEEKIVEKTEKKKLASKRFTKVWNGIESGLRKVKEFEDHLVIFW